MKDLTKVERLEIAILLQKDYSKRAIALVLGRSPNTISYEVRKNSVDGSYNPHKANTKASVRKKGRRFQYSKIEEYPEIKAIIIEKLKVHWNPDEIAGWLQANQPRWYISKSAIYTWLRTARGDRYCDLLYSERHYAKTQTKKTKRVLIPDRVGLEARSKGATHRTRYGHYERDTVVSKKGAPGGLATAQERKSRLLMARLVVDMSPLTHLQADQHLFANLVAYTITRDNGIENRAHLALGIPSFFCDPYSSWQKGGIENANKMIRRYFPKGTDFSLVTQVEVDQVLYIINNKPRKILGYRSSMELATRAGIIKSESVLIEG